MNKWYKLQLAGLGRNEICRLMKRFKTYEEAMSEDINYYRNELKIKEENINKLLESDSYKLDKLYGDLDKYGAKLITIKDDFYSVILSEISNPPPFLFVKGNGSLNKKNLAVVGTRKYTAYGKSATEKFTREMVASGIVVVSGLATGVDTIAHKQVLKSGGETIAVMGTGLDTTYPSENRYLADEICEKGLLVSEYGFGVNINRWHFPERNRIVVGLSEGVLITESYESGGSLISGKLALDENRELFAIPGFISYPSFEGCNNLIKRGEAKLVAEIDDILEEFNWRKESSEKEIELTELESKIYARLFVEKSIDLLIIETGISGRDIMIILMEMEIKGYLKSLPGGRYIRV